MYGMCDKVRYRQEDYYEAKYFKAHLRDGFGTWPDCCPDPNLHERGG